MAKRKTRAEAAIDGATLEPDPMAGLGVADIADITQDEAVGPEAPGNPPTPAPEDVDPPEPVDPEWSDYVLSHFLDDEKDPQGRPTNDGLRRVVEKLLGPIVESDPTPLKLPTMEDQSASVKSRVTIAWGGDRLDLRTFGGLADVNEENVGQPKFLPFALATADTRAESRAFRKALKLRKVLSADEIQIPTMAMANTPATPARGPGGLISDPQEKSIRKTCRDIRIDPLKYLAANGHASFAGVSHEEAGDLCEGLQSYFQKPETIPQELLIEKP